jgi:hypothetical protein
MYDWNTYVCNPVSFHLPEKTLPTPLGTYYMKSTTQCDLVVKPTLFNAMKKYRGQSYDRELQRQGCKYLQRHQ